MRTRLYGAWKLTSECESQEEAFIFALSISPWGKERLQQKIRCIKTEKEGARFWKAAVYSGSTMSY